MNKDAQGRWKVGMSNIKSKMRVKDTAVPDYIDRSMLSSLSGGDQTALLAGLRFLALIEGDDDKTTDSFHVLIEARKHGSEKWKAALGEVIRQRYERIVDGVNVGTTTKAKIQECFRNAGVAAGQMTDKSIRFYLKALEESGGTVSPHLKALKGRAARRPASGTTRRKAVRRSKPDVPPPGAARGDTPKGSPIPKGFERLPIPGLNDAFIQYPADLTAAHCKLFEAAITLLRTSVEVSAEEGSE